MTSRRTSSSGHHNNHMNQNETMTQIPPSTMPSLFMTPIRHPSSTTTTTIISAPLTPTTSTATMSLDKSISIGELSKSFHSDEPDDTVQQYQYDINNDNGDDGKEESSSSSSLRRSPQRPSCFVIQVTMIASLGGILFGYDLGIISCALPQLIHHFDLVPKQQELVVSILYMGGICGATMGGSICDLFGRKKSILLCDVIFGMGAIVLYAAQNVSTILVGRVVVGFAIALSGIADVTYLHEIAPVQFRGAIVSVNEACIALGFLLAFGIGSVPALSYSSSVNDAVEQSHVVEGWRIMFGISGIVALLQFIGMLYLPESPKWLKDRGRQEESVIAQHRIQSDPVLYHGTSTTPPPSLPHEHQRKNSRTLLMSIPSQNKNSRGITRTASRSPVTVPVSSNYQTISSPGTSANHIHDDNDDVDSIMKSTKHRGLLYRICCCPVYQTIYLCQQFCTFLRTLTSTQHRRQTYISMFLATTQQFCGQTNVLSYAPLIFAAASVNSDSGTDASMEAYATVSIGIMKFIVTVLVIWKIESVGRRSLLLWGIATISVGLFLLAVAFAGTKVVHEQNADSNGAEAQQGDEGEGSYAVVKSTYSGFYLAVPGVLLVVCGYSMSYGPLTWLITSELYPTEIRGRALGVSTIVTYACAAIVTYTFLSATAWVGSSVLFSCYLLMTCIGFLFAYMAIPDTGGRNPEGIDTDLDQMVWWQGQQQRNVFVRTSMGSKHTTLSSSDQNISDFVAETEIT